MSASETHYVIMTFAALRSPAVSWARTRERDGRLLLLPLLTFPVGNAISLRVWE